MRRFFLVSIGLVLLNAVAFGAGQSDSGSAQELAPVTIAYNIYNTSLDYEKDDVYRWIKEKYNVEFKHYQASGADWQEKLQIWVASGDMPDVMNWDFKYHHMPQYNEWVRLGALRPLPDDLSKYPNLKDGVLDKMITDELLMIDGKRYSLPHVRSYAYLPGEGLEYIWEGAHIVYRRDWAKQVGLYKENDIYTWDEFIELCKAFIDQDPGNNGPGRTIGYTMHSFGFSQGFTGVLYTYPDYMGYGPGYVKKGGKYVWVGNQPELIEGIKAFRRIVDAGVLWSDQPIAKGAEGLDRFYAGESGAMLSYNSTGGIRNARQKMIKLHGLSIEEARDAVAPMHIERADGSLFALPLDDYWSIAVFSAKMSDEKMDRWLQLQDWNSTTEGFFSARYGFKGEGWEYDSNGDIKVLWDLDPETKKFIAPDNVVNGWNQFWANTHEDGYVRLPKTDVAMRELKVFEDIEAFLGQYKGRITGYTKPDPYPKFFSGENFNKYGNFAGEVHEKIVEIVYGNTPYDRIGDVCNEWVETKMPQVQSVLDELNSGI